MKPIDEVEADFRRIGSFLLVGPDGKLSYYSNLKQEPAIKKLMESLKGRQAEMIKFLISRASVRGETK